MDNQESIDMNINEAVDKYWKVGVLFLTVAVTWGTMSQKIAEGQERDRAQDKAIERIQDQQKQFNGTIVRNTESIRLLTREISRNTETNEKLLDLLLKQKGL